MKLSFDCDKGSATKAAFGLILLSVDETIESEIRPLLHQEGVSLLHARIESSSEVTSEKLMQMKARLTDTAALLPGTRPLDVIAYGCTSGATVIGSDEVAASIQVVHPGARVTDPARAVLAAFTQLGVSRIAIVSPYVEEVSEALCRLLEGNDATPARVGSFGQAQEAVVARISLRSVEEAICEVGKDPEIEAVFASCTNLRTLPVIETCERRLGKPVISSNLALA
jgi:maleate isomerase